VCSLGKTETIKERAVWVYLPSIEQKKRWQKFADQSGVSLSKWVIETVEEAIRPTEEQELKPRKDLEEEIEGLKKEVAGLRGELRQQKIIREKLERELRRYRAKPFLAPKFEGIRRYDKQLIEVLRSSRNLDEKPKALTDMEILQYLGIDPTEEEAVKAVSTQLENLEAYGIVKSTPKGWRWIE
jgi:predicted RNase H-like nuclease (RuvC/YqgF family)